EDTISLFLPAVPNPTTGFLLFVPRKDVQPLDLTVEQGLKLVISGGVVTPEVLAAAGETRLQEAARPQKAARLGLVARPRNYLLAGVLVTAPAAITFWLVAQFIDFVDSRVTPLLPAAWRPETYLPIGVPGLGVLLSLIALTLIGMLAAGMIGRWFLRTANWLFRRVPFVGQELAEDECVHVVLATTPNPTAGFLRVVARKDMSSLNMTIEDAMKMIVSCGLVAPASEKLQEPGREGGPSGEDGGELLPMAA